MVEKSDESLPAARSLLRLVGKGIGHNGVAMDLTRGFRVKSRVGRRGIPDTLWGVIPQGESSKTP